MQNTVDLLFHIFACVTIICAADFLDAPLSWNCSTKTDFCMLSSQMNRSWHDASAYCFQRNGGLAHSTHSKLILMSPILSSNELVWIGLGWVEQRLQWMTHIPHEETNITVIDVEANNLLPSYNRGKFCYTMNRLGRITLNNCARNLSFICVKPIQIKEDYLPENTTVLTEINKNSFRPELFPMGEFLKIKHSDLFVIEPSSKTNFNLHCKVSNNTLAMCSKIHYRWVKNGAYKPDGDGKTNILVDFEETLLTDKTPLTVTWLGKIACEIFCFSTGKTYRSEEIVLSLPQFLTLQIDFTFSRQFVSLREIELYFRNQMRNGLKNQTTSQSLPIYYTEQPQIIPHARDKAIDTFRFYAHLGPLVAIITLKPNENGIYRPTNYNYGRNLMQFCHQDENDILRLTAYLRNINYTDVLVNEKNPWFKSITVFTVNYRRKSLNLLSCMTPFHDHKKHCVRIIHPQQFSKSITQCTAGYQNDQLDASWDLSTWIKFSLGWLDENKNVGEYSALKFDELWLPAQRRTTLGSLWPVWPWNITTLSLQENSWGDEMKSIVIRSGLHADWTRLNASLSCLALDTETKSVKSVSCQKVLPMICVRPKMKWNPSIFHESNRNFALRAQCPFGWLTSTLISERNFCYKIFNNSAIKFTFDEAEAECKKQDARLAIASQPSALAVLLNIFAFEELTQTPDFWIGLKKSGKGFKWTDQSYWVYEKEIEHDFDGKASLNNNAYGVSFIVLPEIANEIPQSPTIKWKVWPKEARLNSFICQKEIFPQREAVLQIHLDDTFRPEVVRKLLDPLHDEDKNQSEMNKTLTDLVSSKLVCFFDNYVNYVSTEKLTSRNSAIINYKIIEGEIPGVLGWRVAEISCETWDDCWSPEPMRASWMMSGNPNGAVSFSSFIVWLRHRTVKYSSEIHDATFKASNSHREAFKHTLNETFVREFVKLHPRYSDRVMAAPEPVAFESEMFPNQQLLVKYRIVINLNNPVKGNLLLALGLIFKRLTMSDSIPDSWASNDEETLIQDVHKFFSREFNSSNSDFRPTGVDLDFISVRSTDFCHGEITSTEGEFITFSSQPRNLTDQLHWPQSTVGFSVSSTPFCVTKDGVLLRRRCLGDRSSGLYWESIHNNESGVGGSSCVQTSDLFQNLLAIKTMDNSSQILETIRQNISGWNPIVAEVDLLGQTLKKCVHYTNEDGKEDRISDFVTIVQEIHDLNTDTLIGAQQTSPFSSNLAEATEKILATINNSDFIENSTSHRFSVESQYIAAGSWDRVDNDTDIIGFSVATKKNSIVRTSVLSIYPTSEEIEQCNTVVLLPFQHISEKEKVTFIAYPDARIIDASAASEKFASKVFMADTTQPDRWSQSKDLYTGNGGMVQVHLNPTPPRLQKPIKILFRPKFPTTEDKRHLLRCVFWNEQMNSGYGGWSTDGCWYEGTGENGMEVCLCNHLSTFTLLVSRSEKELQDTDHGKVLTIITLIGSSASILGLSLILATFIFFPPWRKPLGHKILFQFSSALIFLLLTFTFGVGYTQNVIVCQIVAIFLHYFLLSGFCWMTVEAYHQYHRFVKVFGAYMPRFLLKASIFAWGLPVIPVASVLLYDVDSYTGSEGYCWLCPIPFYSAVLGPVVFLLIINLIIFVLVVRSIIAAGRGLRTNQSESKQTKNKLLTSFLNFVLLGLTWIFGFLAIGATNAVIFSYLFCVTSSLQGFIIFVLYVGRDHSARKMWLELFGVGKSEIRTVEPKTKSTVSKTTGNSESCSTTVATGNSLSSDEVQYVGVVPFKIEVRQAQLEATTNFD